MSFWEIFQFFLGINDFFLILGEKTVVNDKNNNNSNLFLSFFCSRNDLILAYWTEKNVNMETTLMLVVGCDNGYSNKLKTISVYKCIYI